MLRRQIPPPLRSRLLSSCSSSYSSYPPSLNWQRNKLKSASQLPPPNSLFLLHNPRHVSTDSGDQKKKIEGEIEDKSKKSNLLIRGLKVAYSSTKEVVMNPRETWQWIKDGAHHYWVGSKLLWEEIKITGRILGRVSKGHEMTRRERRQLIRTTGDMFRLVPFAIFVIVPFMELLLPLCLKLFPNMLPSTFEDSMKKEEQMKKELTMRLAYAKFMQETLQEIAQKKSQSESVGNGAKEILEFVEQARKGEHISNDKVVNMARLFRDDLTLPNLARPQLVAMCKYMGLTTYGSDDFLRFQLRNKFRMIKEDDRRILWEGIDSLNTLELREACRERGMRAFGITQFRLKNQLQEWLQLSTHKSIPISLLIMSRAFSLTESEEPEDILKSSMSSLDRDTINEVVVASASPGEEKTIDMQMRKLESLKFQEELIEEEIESKESQNKQKTLLPSREHQQPSTSPGSPSSSSSAAKEKRGEEEKKQSNNDNNANGQQGPSSSSSSSSSAPPSQALHHEKKANDQKLQSSLSAVAKGPADLVEQASKKELSLQEMQALSDLAGGFFREKAELHVLQTMLESLPSTRVSSSSAAAQEDDDAHHKGIPILRSALQNMLKKLQKHIETTEKIVGDKLTVLDKDKDGQISSEELKDAIVHLLRRDFSEKEAEDLVDTLDQNKDGQISVRELLDFIKHRRERVEASVSAAESPLPVAPLPTTLSSSSHSSSPPTRL